MKQRIIRHKRIRAKIKGTAERPRLSVFRSNRHIFAQLIDDIAGKTIAAVSDKEIKPKGKTKKTVAYEIGKLLSKKAVEKDIKETVFDRGGYKFHGAVSEIAKGAREGGLKF
ncbi:MAG: 50S ribosomal protein L18 [Candidatus Azambacteria bacterium GW2011_GWA1_44_9]|uniref:Large ribosomal subunit protein uL18 n=1 Tax=Candidatus Azambacteria bacterium GW2011_GWA1_44_9 TaxID=1618610 RepID=A0A0G1KBQ4_9BACT|nr:MAG: 50S ribosomal protein L18 [Candidatus Azambacteria bacterium GW2011_GWA1_44_9]